MLIRIPKSWQLPEKKITPETVFLNRRRFLKNLAWAGIGASIAPLASCYSSSASDPLMGTKALTFKPNKLFSDANRPLTEQNIAATYNNFYEFGGTKSIWQNAAQLPTENWKVEVTGLVNKPRIFDLDDLYNTFELEERIYRFRCVEAWAMVLPWIGFPMKALLSAVEPTAKAKFVRFTSFYDAKIMPGPSWGGASFPFPYTEGLRIEEMATEVAFFAVGIYGNTLPKQHGAPIRAVLPWKYGYKGAKSIVKIEFTAEQPVTFWNSLYPQEYPFESNVNPKVAHPRWSQKEERLLKENSSFEVYPTLLYNGYGEYVAHLYS